MAVAAQAQQAERMRRIGVLMSLAADNTEGRAADAHSCRGYSNWAGPTAATSGSIIAGRQAILTRPQACGGIGRACAGRHPGQWRHGAWRRCLQATRTCRSCSRRSPIRSAPASSKAWRGRAATSPASSLFEYGLSGKWLELLKQIAPGVTRAAVLRDHAAPASAQFAAIQAAAPSLGVEVSPIDIRDAGEIERDVAAFARGAEWRPDRDGERLGDRHRDLIITLAARHRLPAIYSDRFFVAGGGLISYGPTHRPVPARRRLCRPHPQGREAGRPAGAGADQV